MLKKKEKKIAEDFLDKFLKGDNLKEIRWLLEVAPLSDARDVALGYMAGRYLSGVPTLLIIDFGIQKDDAKLYAELISIFSEKAPEILEKIESELTESLTSENL
jgi:hypothetical protein